jgi:hypothetical protein
MATLLTVTNLISKFSKLLRACNYNRVELMKQRGGRDDGFHASRRYKLSADLPTARVQLRCPLRAVAGVCLQRTVDIEETTPGGPCECLA